MANGGQVPELTLLRAAPPVFILLHLGLVILTAVRKPAWARNAWKIISSPFRNFLQLDDLLEPVDKKPRNTWFEQHVLTGIACIELVIWMGRASFELYLENYSRAAVCSLYALSWIYIGLALLSKPVATPPYLFLGFSAALASLAFFDLVYLLSSEQAPEVGPVLGHSCSLVLHALFIGIAGTLPLQPYIPGPSVAEPDATPSSKQTCPEDNVNLWAWSSFNFVEPIIRLASTRTLNDEDVWSLSPFFSHKNIFTKCLEYRRMHPTHSLLRFLITSNSLDLILDVTLELWSAVVGFVPPYALQQILSVLREDTVEARRTAYFWAFMTFLAHLSFAQVDLYQQWHTRRCYERTRGQLFCLIHYKSLKREEVSGHVAKEEGEEARADLGKIVNLMQGDTYTVAQRFWEFSGIVTTPVRIVIALIFLYKVLGWSALMGVGVSCVAYAINYPLMTYSMKVARATLKAKDKRNSIVDEMLQNIRFLKFYGWGRYFLCPDEYF